MVTHFMDSGASWATVHGVAMSWTRLKLNNNNNNPQIAEIKKRSYTTDNIQGVSQEPVWWLLSLLMAAFIS